MTKEQILQRQQELIRAARNEDRDLTVQEQAEFDRLQRSLEAMEEEDRASGSGQRTAAFQESRGAGAQPGEDPAGREQAAGAPVSPEQAAQRAIEAERQRMAQITSLCRSFQISPDEYIQNGSSLETVRAAVLEQLQRTGAPVNARVTADEGDKFRERASDGLMMRAGISLPSVADGAGQMRGMSLRDLAIECLAREGKDTMSLLRMDMTDLYADLCRQFYNPTAAFPAILDNTIRKSITHQYNLVPTTFQAWTTKGSLSDFKETKDHEYVIGGVGDFLEVPENGELKADTPDTKLLPSRSLKTYGRQFSMTRQAFINDDIGFLTEIPGLYATKAKKTIDKAVYGILYDNKPVFDKKSLFHADHNNLIAVGAKPSQASLQEMILQMQKQKDPFGDAIYVTPQYIIVPVGYEFDLAVILHSTQVTGSNHNDINPLYNYPIHVIQTPVLNALAKGKEVPWFMAANPASAKSIQVDYLNGQETPTFRRMEAPGVLGFTWDIYLDWGIAVRDFRGIAKNPGVAIE